MKIKEKFLILVTAVFCFTLCACSNNNQKISEKSEIKTYETSLVEKSSEKTEITIGITAPNPDINGFISGFNSSNDSYIIKIEDYYDPDGTVTEMQNNLKIDVVSGKSPDIILCESSIFYYTLSSKGVFTDISEIFSENEILPNIREICTESDGKIYRVPLGFSVTTGITKAENGAESCEIFSYDKMNEIMNNLDSGTMLSGDMMSALYCTKESILCDFTNRKNLTCHFNSSEFAKALEFYSKINNMKYEYSEDNASYVNGKALIYYATLCNAINIYTIKNDVFNSEDIVITPAEHTRLTLNQSIAILNSISEEKKQGAFEFIKYVLSDDNVNTETPIWFPITESGLNICLNIEVNSNGKYEYSKLTNEDIEYFSDYIKKVNHESFFDYTIKKIFEEETERYINGNCSAKECGDSIQQRTTIYLDEQK